MVPGGGIALAAVVILPVVGTIYGAYFLYMFCSAKGRMVLSPQYVQIVDKIPPEKLRTSLAVWIIGAVVIAGIIFVAFY